MKRLYSIERKWFPNESAYQRIRRRRAMFFGVILIPLLIFGVAKAITRFSGLTGGTPVRAKAIKFKQGWQKK